MIRINEMVKVENRADWDEHYNANWDRFDHNCYPHDINLTSFPIYMRREEAWDTRCCGRYVVITKDEWDKAKEKKIKELQEHIRVLENS